MTSSINNTRGTVGSNGYKTFANESDEESRELDNAHTTSSSPDTSNFNNGYEELMKGSRQCPTCRGLGRIPQNEAEQLVALIPISDKRLRPQRTAQWVMLSVIICILIAGLTLFFLFPRNVRALSNQPDLEPSQLQINLTEQFVYLSFRNKYNFSNENYIPVSVTGVTMSVQYDRTILKKVVNKTEMIIPQLSAREYHVRMNLTLDGDQKYLVKFCNDPRRWVHDMFMQFELTANYSYFGHIEQTTLTTYQHVSCGNDTKSPY
ncbi:transmembrane protein 106B-like [Argonauta hians]